MVTLNKIYTRTGDDGGTGLATGARVSKTDPRVEAYGAVDETNAAVGLARTAIDDPSLDNRLKRIQNDLFDLGADLATPGPDDALGFEPLRVTPNQVTALETDIDELNEPLAALDSFVLPAGSEAAARLHLARTTCRRAERRAVALAESAPDATNPSAIQYLNRLSDFLFIAARSVNAAGSGDEKWVPGAHRG